MAPERPNIGCSLCNVIEGGITLSDRRTADAAAAVADEQGVVDRLYARLDELIAEATERLRGRESATGLAGQQRPNVEALWDAGRDRLVRLESAEDRLCFGRLDLDPDQAGPEPNAAPRYIGRTGLLDEDADHMLLVDWRAPQARPFYVATALNRMGVRRRRHLTLRRRTVVGVDDELLDHTLLASDAGTAGDTGSALVDGLVGEGALLAAVGAQRTGRMGDIVATIQADQDAVIRADDARPVVVQGGPGTGKTAVALHRAAYLLYTRREQLSRRGVLVVGPSPQFLRYIDDVLPSLGETSVVLATPTTLVPGLRPSRIDAPDVVELKGRAVWASILADAVARYQHAPRDGVQVMLNGEPVRLDAATCRRVRGSARGAHLPHNDARRVFRSAFLTALARRVAAGIAAEGYAALGRLNPGDLDGIRAELADEPQVQHTMDRLWPRLSAERVLDDLLARPDRLRSAAAGRLDPDELAALHRPGASEPGVDTAGYSDADAALLDELAQLLGGSDPAAAAREHRERQRESALAEQVLADAEQAWAAGGYQGPLAASHLITADALAERHRARDTRSLVERATADREWLYGHVIVDEAQELSAMQWRMILRRCPSRSITAVGDVAQSSSPGGARSWAEQLTGVFADRWQVFTLSVNYRTPSEISVLADAVLAEIDPAMTPPRAVRSTGVAPVDRTVVDAELARAAGDEAERLQGEVGGTVVILAPTARTAPIRAVAAERVSVLTPREAKGLEFDSVVLVAPDEVVAADPRGRNDLYVALTRATQRLTILRPSAEGRLGPDRQA